ncbi:MAG: hypothetical protein Q9214_006277 [Letrouitia sp. 1 TL-2023]
MCCWPFVDVELEDPPKVKKEEEKKEYVLVSDKLHVVSRCTLPPRPSLILSIITAQFHLPQYVLSPGCLSPFHSYCNKSNFIGKMFYYNYEGLYPGTLRVNLHATEAPQAPAAQPIKLANPWLAPKPKEEPHPVLGPPTPQNYYKYVPRYSQSPEPVPNASKPVNPWLAPKPQEAPQLTLPAVTYQPRPQLVYSTAPALEPTKIWYGATKDEIDQQNAAAARAHAPVPLVPANPSPSQQFWCRELDGSYTLRTMNDISTSCQPGVWQQATETGYPYFVRKAT